jgi:hypothetical protein
LLSFAASHKVSLSVSDVENAFQAFAAAGKFDMAMSYLHNLLCVICNFDMAVFLEFTACSLAT